MCFFRGCVREGPLAKEGGRKSAAAASSLFEASLQGKSANCQEKKGEVLYFSVGRKGMIQKGEGGGGAVAGSREKKRKGGEP